MALESSAQQSVYQPGVDPGVGFNLISWNNFGSGGTSVWENAVQSLHDAGFDEVSLSPVRFYQPGSGSIASSSSSGPELSHIAAGIVKAKSLGMRVTVNPFVEPENFTQWRGLYDPTPGSSESINFWNDYQQYVGDVATMAQANGADSMTIGTELRSLVRNTGNSANWSQLINDVDSKFAGSIGYSANWDNYNHATIAGAIWDHPEIDFLGIDAYFPEIVSQAQADASGAFGNEAFINAARDGWNQLLDDEILPYAAARQNGSGLAVEFTEVGYLPYNRTGVEPQNSSGQALDSDEQNMMFAGLMRAFDGRLESDGLLAAHIWQWDMPGSGGSLWNLNPNGNGGNQPNNLQSAQWLSNFVSNPATVPEPNGASLLLLAAAATAVGRRRGVTAGR